MARRDGIAERAGHEEMLAKATGLPLPAVQASLRRLWERGYLVRVAEASWAIGAEEDLRS